MDNIEAINIIDGNQYLVNNASVSSVDNSGFDDIYKSQSEENSLDAIFDQVANEYGVDVNLLKAVAQAESGFDAGAVSYCGAQGIMQLMPATAQSLGVEDPFDAKQSITGGAKMLAYLLDDYNGNASLALAAYNAGSGNVAKYGGVPPFNETINYINKINGFLNGALSNDSYTINGSEGTDFSEVNGSLAPDVSIHGLQSAIINVPTEEGISNTFGSALSSGVTYTDDMMFSFEDYLYFAETYNDIMDRLFSDVNDEMNIDDGETEDVSSLVKVPKENTLLFDTSQININMLKNDSAYNILKTDAQSIYQAQASVVSPLVERLFNR